jgi:hypothetical protein
MDKYILRLANSNNAPGVRNTATFEKFSIDLPNGLKNKGKCIVRVVNSTMVIEDDFIPANRIIPEDTRVVAIKSNIASLGYDTESRGSSNTILGNAIVVGADKVITLSSGNDSFHFVCPSLPDVIELTKMYVDPTTNLLTEVLNESEALYCNVTLEITFITDLLKN